MQINANTGKKLEALVALVEQFLLPQGFVVRTNRQIYGDDGKQIAEFDIEISGKVGSTNFTWLIECRDRPSDGAAPCSWIEQLDGRRTRFNFNKVTAVSTTGFAKGAVEFAERQGIELREVRALEAKEFEAWLKMESFRQIEQIADLKGLTLNVFPTETPERKQILQNYLGAQLPGSAILKQSKPGGQNIYPRNAFLGALTTIGNFFEGILPDAKGKKINLHVEYVNDEDHFVVETEAGPIRIKSIDFHGELRVRETIVRVTSAGEYRHSSSGKIISQYVAFGSQSQAGIGSIEMHRIVDSKETYLVLRQADNIGS